MKEQLYLFDSSLFRPRINSQDIVDYEKKDYFYLQEWTMDKPYVPERIKLPSGEIYDISEIRKKAEHFTEIQLEMLNALDYYDLIQELELKDRGFYPSFIDENDKINMSGKYSGLDVMI